MARTRPSSEHFRNQSDLILRSAVEVFATEGFAQTSMRRIAERAGVSKSLIYHYHEGKEALLFEAMRDYLNRLSTQIASIADMPREMHLSTKLRRLLREYRSARFHHMILMQEIRNLPTEKQDRILSMQKSVVDDMRSAIGRSLPHLTGEDLKAVTMLVFGMVNWIHTWYSEAGPVSPSRLAELVDIMVRGAVSGLAEGSSVRSAA